MNLGFGEKGVGKRKQKGEAAKVVAVYAPYRFNF
jgi:hypothetical protein